MVYWRRISKNYVNGNSKKKYESHKNKEKYPILIHSIHPSLFSSRGSSSLLSNSDKKWILQEPFQKQQALSLGLGMDEIEQEQMREGSE
jgi:hypothetical protein